MIKFQSCKADYDEGVMLLGHKNIRWNPVTKEWFCASCGRTSDKGSEWDARIELQQSECEPPTEIRSKTARMRQEALTKP